ncbi:hypothetical protein SAMN04488041_11047 [Sulfitobacter pontiacus]|uniref:Uncharacterized protein n=1 Tax=Sulfitobacter pontiacus TaxID=60137 RepID=A0A1H3DCP8_9RHOB|nr:hypothetical protein SAMN04488041_11047 [Sulfitobacter pontiacus]
MGARMDTVAKGAMDFEPEALADFLAETFGGKAPVTIERIAGGLEPDVFCHPRGRTAGLAQTTGRPDFAGGPCH